MTRTNSAGYIIPKSEWLIAEATGANRVVVFDHTIRRRTPGVEPIGRRVSRASR